MRAICIRLWPFIVVLLLASPLAAAERPSWILSAGTFDTATSDFLLEVGLEHRRPVGKLGLDWGLGLSATEEESVWGHIGLRRDFALSARWLLTPGFGVALYEEGDGKDLGGPIEFRSSIEVFVSTSPRAQLGLSFYHLSNAGIYDDNPGANSLVLMFRYAK